jgi:hypothetical protein
MLRIRNIGQWLKGCVWRGGGIEVLWQTLAYESQDLEPHQELGTWSTAFRTFEGQRKLTKKFPNTWEQNFP